MITLPLLTEGYDITGIDLDEPSVRFGQELLVRNGLPASALQTADLRDLAGTFDVIIASEVLEHLDDGDLQAVLAAIRERLSTEGLLLVTVPNGYGWFELEARLWFGTSIDRLFRRQRVNRVVSRAHHLMTRGYVDAVYPSTVAVSPHRQRFTYRSIRRLLTEAGFTVVDGRGSVLIAGPFSHLLFTGITPVMRLNALLGRRLPWIAAGFYLAGRRRQTAPARSQRHESASRSELRAHT